MCNCRNTTMTATVLEVFQNRLVVRDEETGQRVVVHTNLACRFSVGQRVRITYNGVMALSEPPQITALSICLLPSQGGCRPCGCGCD